MSHFAPKAERCIFIFLEGGPSQMDLFDPKPLLNKYDGQALPPSIVGDAKFAFLQKDTATVMGTSRVFKKHGQCGMEISDLLPHIATCADDIALIRSMHTTQFNHLPGQLMLNCGAALLGRPSVGSWVTYGLGNTSQELPSYVVMVSKGRGLPGGSSTWSSGFLPSSYGGVMFRNGTSPVLNLANPDGITPAMQESSLGVLNDLNRLQHKHIGDPEIASRINSFELAYRMQQTAPELMDISKEPQHILDMYGAKPGEASFANNCLLARRLIESGVRFVQLFHEAWDHHGGLTGGLKTQCGLTDKPCTALVRDLKQRGLLEDTIVIWGGEFGRTPMFQGKGGPGRDHHMKGFSIWMAGGGIRGGLSHGATDELGYNSVEKVVHVRDMHATMLHLLGFDHERLTYRYAGRDYRLTDIHGKVISELMA